MLPLRERGISIQHRIPLLAADAIGPGTIRRTRHRRTRRGTRLDLPVRLHGRPV